MPSGHSTSDQTAETVPPAASQPEGAPPSARKPEVARAAAFQSEAAHSPASRPEVAHSSASQSEAAHSPAYQPEAAHSPAYQPEAAHSRASRPEAAPSGASRRTVLRGIGAVGVGGAAAAALAACGPGGGSGGQATPSAAADIAKTTDIPVGGGKIFADQQIVVTQPTAGTFKAFSAICTHQQCTVNQIQNGQIECPCHGSQYSIVDGSVTVPAVPGSHQNPLPQKTVTISGDEISVS